MTSDLDYVASIMHTENDEPVPGKYADDARFGFIILSGASFFVSLMVSILDGWQEACYFMLAAIYLALVYIGLEDR